MQQYRRDEGSEYELCTEGDPREAQWTVPALRYRHFVHSFAVYWTVDSSTLWHSVNANCGH